MPNEVYRTAHRELAEMVSARAAQRVLDDALQSARVDRDTVTARQMRDVILGRVRDELRGVLPPDGLRRNLHRLVRHLRDLQHDDLAGAPLDRVDPPNDDRELPDAGARGPATSTAAVAHPAAGPAAAAQPADGPDPAVQPSEGPDPEAQTSVAPDPAAQPGGSVPAETPAPEAPASQVPAVEAAEPVSEGTDLGATAADPSGPAHVAGADRPQGEQRTETAGTLLRAPLLGRELSDAELQRVALAFARVENATFVAVIRDGDVRFSRGARVDADAAGRLIPVAARLLARQGDWRSYTLIHDQGQLLVTPVGGDFIVVAGRSEFNLGAAYATLASLEEEL